MAIILGSMVAGSHGMGAVAESSPLSLQASVREREKLGMVWAFEASESSPPPQ